MTYNAFVKVLFWIFCWPLWLINAAGELIGDVLYAGETTEERRLRHESED